MRNKWVAFGLVMLLMCMLLGLTASEAKKHGGFKLQAETFKPVVSDLYEGITPDEKLLRLDKHALDEAYNAQLLLLFSVWLKGQAGDPTQFNNGLKIARRAYTQASDAIVRREEMLRSRGAPAN